MPHLSLRRFGTVLDFGKQFRLHPDTPVRDPLGIGLSFSDQGLGAFIGRGCGIDNPFDRFCGEFLRAQPSAGLADRPRGRLELQPQLDKPADGFTFRFPRLPRWQRLGVVSPTSFLVSM